VRPRATSSEWACYYEHVDRVRRRLGDPFRHLIERGARRERGFRIVVIILALGAGAALVLLALSLVNNTSFQSVFD